MDKFRASAFFGGFLLLLLFNKINVAAGGRCDDGFCACAVTRTFTANDDLPRMAIQCPEWMSTAFESGVFKDVQYTYCSPPPETTGKDMVLCLAFSEWFFSEEFEPTRMGDTSCRSLDEYFPGYPEGTFRASRWTLLDGRDRLVFDYFTLLGPGDSVPTLPANVTTENDFILEGADLDPVPICPDDAPFTLPQQTSSAAGGPSNSLMIMLTPMIGVMAAFHLFSMETVVTSQ